MKVLMLNGSPKKNGNTAIALSEMEKIFAEQGIEAEIVQMGSLAVRGCMDCGFCNEHGKCVIDDIVNTLAEKLETSDGLVLASPVHYGCADSMLTAALDRLFFSSRPMNKTMKVGACVVVARRGGCSATYDRLHKYFGLSGMPIATSCYWNSVHGLVPGEALEDPEGMRTVRTLARNMSFMMKSIALGKAQFGLPETEKGEMTNFIR